LVRREIVNEARRSADLLWAIGRPDEFARTVEVIGEHHAVSALAAHHGVLLAGVHIGGWEVAAAVPASVIPAPTSVIVADDWLAWAIQHVRTAVGLRIIYRSTHAIAAARVLTRGEALLVLGDDSWGDTPRLQRVRFCDSEAALPIGIATLARLTGAAIVPFAVLPLAPRRWRVTIDPGIPPAVGRDGGAGDAAVLQAVADRWSAIIRAHPDQWAASFRIAWIDE
jgi:lauroyl/myristoyl acyltransferase